MSSTLEECFETLERTLPADTLAAMRAGTEADMIRHHHSVGMWIRNQWRQSGGIPREVRRLHHMDDMSALVLETFWCHLHGQPLRIKERVARYEHYWRRHTPPKPARPPGCDAEVTFDVVQNVKGADGIERAIHAGRSTSDGTLWAWELDRGWFRPEPGLREILEACIRPR